MTNIVEFKREAPLSTHNKLDRLWLHREQEGSVHLTTVVKDPDSPNELYHISITLTGIN